MYNPTIQFQYCVFTAWVKTYLCLECRQKLVLSNWHKRFFLRGGWVGGVFKNSERNLCCQIVEIHTIFCIYNIDRNLHCQVAEVFSCYVFERNRTRKAVSDVSLICHANVISLLWYHTPWCICIHFTAAFCVALGACGHLVWHTGL